MKPEFIYFDLDDTLLDHRKAEKEGLEDVFHHFEMFSDITLESLVSVYHEVNKVQWKRYGNEEISRDELQRNRFEQTLQQLGVDAGRYDEVGSFYMKAYQDHWQWINGAEEAYHTIRKQYPVGILTNGFSETQKLKFEKFDLYESARHLVISEDVGYLKPHPRIFEHATRLTDKKAEEILYVGDSLNSDVKGGTEFGWRVAWFKTNGQVIDTDKAVFVFSDFNDLLNLLKV